jgi:small nuclear ribonucleoprotein (snRNP)-like protein
MENDNELNKRRIDELKNYIGKEIRIKIKDNRVIEGEFQCIDRELNFIIGFSIDILNYHYNDYVLKVELLKCMV